MKWIKQLLWSIAVYRTKRKEFEKRLGYADKAIAAHKATNCMYNRCISKERS